MIRLKKFDEDLGKIVPVTPKYHAAIARAAADHGLSVSDLVRLQARAVHKVDILTLEEV